MRRMLVLALLASSLPAAQAEERVDFNAQVKPVFASHCYSCHGEEKGLGGLRLHGQSLAVALESDGLVVSGDPASSELYKRLTLRKGDKKRMPKGGKPLGKDQIELVRLWIEQGAKISENSPDQNKPGKKKPRENGSTAEQPPTPLPPAVAGETLAKLTNAGANVGPLYTGSTLLTIGFPTASDKVDDATIGVLLEAADNVAWLDLGGSKVSDAGVQKLAAMSNLSRLHLENTAVTDAGIGALSTLPKLEYLNLYGTKVTDAALAALQPAPRLRRLYLWKTRVSYAAAKNLEAAKPGLEVNLGWDHPGVLRERLSRELAAAAAERKVAELEASQAESQLADAKQRIKTLDERQNELRAELEALKQADKEPGSPQAEVAE